MRSLEHPIACSTIDIPFPLRLIREEGPQEVLTREPLVQAIEIRVGHWSWLSRRSRDSGGRNVEFGSERLQGICGFHSFWPCLTQTSHMIDLYTDQYLERGVMMGTHAIIEMLHALVLRRIPGWRANVLEEEDRGSGENHVDYTHSA